MSDDQEMKPVDTPVKDDKPETETEQQEESKEKKEPKKPKSPRKKRELPPVRDDRPKRERKQVDYFAPPETTAAEHAPFEIEEGSGTALSEIPNVEKRLSVTKATESEVKKLHSILFPGAGKGNATKDVVKKHIRQFSGYPGSTSERQTLADKAKEKLETMDLKTVKNIAGILDVATTGSRGEIAERISEFLLKPKASGHAYQAKSRSSSSSKKKGTKRKGSKKEKSGTKRTKNSYMLWREEHYEEFKEKNPKLSITELATKMGEKWRSMSDEKKEKYVKQAKELKAEAADADSDDEPPKKKKKTPTKKSPSKKKSPAKKTKSKTSKKSKKSESEAESDDDDEEDKEESEEEEEEEEETEDDKKIKLELTLAIEEILKNADLTSLSLKKVREQLQANKAFGESVVTKKKELIRELVTKAVNARQKENKESQKSEDGAADKSE